MTHLQAAAAYYVHMREQAGASAALHHATLMYDVPARTLLHEVRRIDRSAKQSERFKKIKRFLSW